MTIIESLIAFGHENVLCTHGTTIEITKDAHLSRRGNCILGIKASKACADLNPPLKGMISKGQRIKITIEVDNLRDSFYGFGCKELTLLNKKDVVFRKSKFTCDRTVLINCTKSSSELNRDIIALLKEPGKKITITFESDEI